MQYFRIIQLTLILVISSISSSFAIDYDWSDCKDELQKFNGANETNNEKIWALLQAHDLDLSKKCDAAHAKYEKLTGK